MYDIDLENCNIDYINNVIKTYIKISRKIALWLQHLQKNLKKYNNSKTPNLKH